MSDSVTPKQYAAERQAIIIKTITELRERHRLSQRDLADLLGCSPSRIARLESDGHGDYGLGELELLALRFGQEPVQFLNLSSSDRSRLDQAYAGSVTAPALGQHLTCSLPPDVSLQIDTDLELAWSSDGAFLAGAVAGPGGKKYLLCVWEVTSGDLIRTIRTDGYISAIVFNPEGRLIATATEMDTIEVWDWQDQRVAACLDPVTGNSYSQKLWDLVGETNYGIITLLQFSRDGTILAAVNEGHGTLRLWNTATWREIHTLSLPQMFTELEIRRAQLKLGPNWQIVWAEEEEPPSLYGEFSVRQLAFTPDGQMLAVLPYLSRQLEFFSRTGRHIRGENFSRQVRCFDLVGLNRAGEMLLATCGGEEQLFEVWYQRDVYEREFIHTTIDHSPLAATIQGLKILDASCVLGLVQNKERNWKIVNLVSQQPLPLPEANPGSRRVLLAPGGQAVAYPDTTGQIIIQHLRPEYLAQSGAALRIDRARPQQTMSSQLTSLFERTETEEERHENIRLAREQSQVRPETEPTGPVTVAPEPVTDWLERIRSAGAPSEAYGLAILSPEDTTTVPALVDTLSNSYDRVWSVDLPQPGPRIKEHALLAYLTDRPLRRDKSLKDVIARVARNPGDVIIIDHAEKLHHQTLLSLCSTLQPIADIFLLLVRNRESFMTEAEKIRAGLEWFLSRAIWYNEPA